MTTESSDLTISRFIGAPRSAVWKAWSDRRHFERWWIPAPLQCKVIKLDLHPGGGLETLMREGDSEFEPHVEGCFLEVVPEQRLIFTTSLTEGWRPAEPWLALTAIMTLMPEGDGTRYMARVLHKSTAEGKRHEELGFYSGWGATIDQLAEVAERMV